MIFVLDKFLRYLIVICIVFLVGCSEMDGPVKRSWGRMKGLENIVGNMQDTSYSKTRSIKPRLNALGHPTTMAQFSGKFVWAEYAAPWCATCAQQTTETQKVKKDYSSNTVFLTIMTSQSQSYEDHATVETAKEWANRYRLNPKYVLAAENLWSKVIPEHRYYSPEGHTLFVHVGFLSSQQMSEVMRHYSSQWLDWKRAPQ